jgi:poly-gamma-glutamate capsule biosynthesis protein CapA/YwtB (metallophosphatase superfamily)
VAIDAEAVVLDPPPSLTPQAQEASDRSDNDAHASVLIAGDLCVTAASPLPGPGAPVPWAPLVGDIRSHDLALVNLECPLTRRGLAISKAGPALWGDPALAHLIAAGGFDGVTLANNHVLDTGAIGLEDTLSACGNAGLATVGAGANLAAAEEPLITDAGGLRIGVVACAEREFSIASHSSPGAAPLDPWTTAALVRDVAKRVDVVIVILHGGAEFATTPRPGLVAACRGLVAAGADAVVCHHSHVAGPVELYDGAPIFYGLGNFLFPAVQEQPEPGWHTGYAVSLSLKSGGAASFRLLPYYQCTAGLSVLPMNESQEKTLAVELLKGAATVRDPALLAAAWEAHCTQQRRHYLLMALGLSRVERHLLRYGLWPAWRRPRRRIGELLDLVTCDSHREALEWILLQEYPR